MDEKQMIQFEENLRFLFIRICYLTGEIKIPVAQSRGTHLIAPRDIIYCKGDNNYCYVFLRSLPPVHCSFPLSRIEAMLNGYPFLRVHKSYFINLCYVTGFDLQRSNVISMTDNIKVTISRECKPGFKTRMLEPPFAIHPPKTAIP